MAEIIFDLSSRYISAFGSLSMDTTPRIVGVEENEQGYEFQVYDRKNENFEDIKFKYENTEINFASIPFINSNDALTKGILAPPPLLRFEQEKALIETPINDNDNVVVERWGTKPWNIRIRGLLIDTESRSYPEDKIKELRQLFQHNGVVDVSGAQFFDKDIESIYFKRFEINGVQGFEDTMQFVLTASSIKPVGFSLIQPNL